MKNKQISLDQNNFVPLVVVKNRQISQLFHLKNAFVCADTKMETENNFENKLMSIRDVNKLD